MKYSVIHKNEMKKGEKLPLTRKGLKNTTSAKEAAESR